MRESQLNSGSECKIITIVGKISANKNTKCECVCVLVREFVSERKQTQIFVSVEQKAEYALFKIDSATTKSYYVQRTTKIKTAAAAIAD